MDVGAARAQALHVALRGLGRATRVIHLAWAACDPTDPGSACTTLPVAYRQWGRVLQEAGTLSVPCNRAYLRGPTRAAAGVILALECAFDGTSSGWSLDPPALLLAAPTPAVQRLQILAQQPADAAVAAVLAEWGLALRPTAWRAHIHSQTIQPGHHPAWNQDAPPPLCFSQGRGNLSVQACANIEHP